MNEQIVEINNGESSELNDRYLLFRIADSLYGVSLALVLEIVQIQSITMLPYVAPYVKGIINLRGKVLPVIDVRTRLGMPEKGYDAETCIVVVDIHNVHVGLIVDSVSEVVTVPEDQIAAPPPSSGTGVGSYLSSVANLDKKIVLNIDFDRFFQDDIDWDKF